ncbi:ABC transporter ATP-binding protein [Paenibacillus thermoaerophilus]|uniref:ABC transporter ATP-binding protein n=1 Tax=Paenibacillus thermoaerophilus TaxID=1215385 RepID=A0ABW2V3Z4_9BACL|nr:ABC transporter ATP-binding protein [Paenibacillus thermoaerophilus]TMV18226.1 ABC transporter ATP-binding protein [Paenibacillus thermoaerophilus]
MATLQLDHITKQYGDKTAVSDLSLEVAQGEIFGLLGANGAGKTTTMRMALGLILPDKGRISWFGKPYDNSLRRRIGYLPEERGLYPKLKVGEQIVYLAQLRGVNKAEAERRLRYWLEKFEVPENYNKKVEELSKGNQQKIQFIAAVIHDPDLLIMDEAFSGLDPVNVELLKDTVKELRDQGKSILFSSHRMDHVEELCRNICILHRSNTVIKGSLREIKGRFPRERVVLETAGSVGGLESLDGVVSVRRHEAGYEVRIGKESAARAVLETAMAQTEVIRFQVMEPTLNEIFIRTVGDRIE